MAHNLKPLVKFEPDQLCEFSILYLARRKGTIQRCNYNRNYTRSDNWAFFETIKNCSTLHVKAQP